MRKQPSTVIRLFSDSAFHSVNICLLLLTSGRLRQSPPISSCASAEYLRRTESSKTANLPHQRPCFQPGLSVVVETIRKEIPIFWATRSCGWTGFGPNCFSLTFCDQHLWPPKCACYGRKERICAPWRKTIAESVVDASTSLDGDRSSGDSVACCFHYHHAVSTTHVRNSSTSQTSGLKIDGSIRTVNVSGTLFAPFRTTSKNINIL